MYQSIVVVLWLLSCCISHASNDIGLLTEDKLDAMFVLKTEQGDCPGEQLQGQFTKFKDISKNQCANYCGLNKDCLGFSFAEQGGECILKSINDCKARTAGSVKFYSKKI